MLPVAAMTDPPACFDAVATTQNSSATCAEMMDSCGRFIDVDKIAGVPTSLYVVKAVRG